MKLKCPNCEKEFDINRLKASNKEIIDNLLQEKSLKIREEIKNSLTEEYLHKLKQKEKEFSNFQNQERLKVEKMVMENESLKKELTKLKDLYDKNIEKEKILLKEKLELEFKKHKLEIENRFKNKEIEKKVKFEELLREKNDLLFKLKNEKNRYEEDIKRQENLMRKEIEMNYREKTHKEQEFMQHKLLLQQKDFENKLEIEKKVKNDLLKQIENLTKKEKAKRISQEFQGEIAEERIQNMLQKHFKQDNIIEVKKGQKGGDIIMEVFEKGIKFGSILIEVKNTKQFQESWVRKLGEDLIINKCDIGLIITKTPPKYVIEEIFFYEKHEINIFSCSMTGWLQILGLIREQILLIKDFERKIGNIDNVKDLLYKRINSPEFKNRIERIKNYFKILKTSLEKQEQTQIKYFQKQKESINVLLLEMIRVGETMNMALVFDHKIKEKIIGNAKYNVIEDLKKNNEKN